LVDPTRTALTLYGILSFALEIGCFLTEYDLKLRTLASLPFFVALDRHIDR
jgi:hypothetical protein